MSKSALIFGGIAKAIRLLPYVLTIMIGVPVAGMALNEASKLVGLKSLPVPVVGTGSMYPSLFWSKEEGGPEDVSHQMAEEYRSTPHLYRRYMGFTLLGKTYLKRQSATVAFKMTKLEPSLQGGKDTSAGFVKRIIAVPVTRLSYAMALSTKWRTALRALHRRASPTYGGSQSTQNSDLNPVNICIRR